MTTRVSDTVLTDSAVSDVKAPSLLDRAARLAIVGAAAGALSGCAVYTVVDTAVGVASTAVETTVDVAAGAVDVVVGDDEDDD